MPNRTITPEIVLPGKGGPLNPSMPLLQRVPLRVLLFLALGLVAASQSGNIIRLGHAHPVAITAWRLLFSSLLLAPLAGRNLVSLLRLGRREMILLLLAGVALTAHFFSWIAAVQLTTVANAAIFFSINPIIVALFAYLFFRERVGKRLLLSVALGLAGVAAIGFEEIHLRPENLRGDIWSMICAVLFSAYVLLGKRLRQILSTEVYVTAVYGLGAVFSFICLLVLQLPLTQYDNQTWLCFLLMALLPTMIGHTSVNNALNYIPAAWLSTLTLTEPIFAGLVAALAWGEAITLSMALGYGLISLSVLVLALDWAQER